ncbi:1-acyl-sn-glycerol-3-phosphate acyltransferase [Conexibacter sp. CPCC 206217]|uniref:lysophospholipid acyltransferase family protein n=1 Tax=Conexibacter sp. CPCC 206217 TaxID=3064574 RepID=UPI002719374B|nr:lysophospholipid acyltransferase family protein [Conexibacter sp. CPCC 206217]MDO8213299.1 lysophospholipid acyltransferase family protein [Conexibacter sp. CPCC 206217]
MANDDRARDQAWARKLPARVAREAIVCGVFDTIIRSYARKRIDGREHLDRLDGPAIFVANHCSHVDTPLLLRSLPRAVRRRTAVAAAADYFYTSRLLAGAVSLAFCTVPLERRGGGRGGSTASLQPLIDDGWSLVVFAEGTRSRDGRVAPLRTGAAMLAAAHGLPLVPIHIAGTHAAMPTGRGWMVRPAGGRRFARHELRVCFGAPIEVGPRDDRFEVMERVRQFMEACGAVTSPDPKLAARRAAAAAGSAGVDEAAAPVAPAAPGPTATGAPAVRAASTGGAAAPARVAESRSLR